MVKTVHSNKNPLASVHSVIDGGEILTNQQLKYIYQNLILRLVAQPKYSSSNINYL